MKQYFVQDYYNAIEVAAPFRLHEPGDNVGLLVGSGEQPVKLALLALDATPGVVAEAKELDAQLIVTHHPIIRDGVKSLPCDGVIYKAIHAGLAVISAHTNLDIADGGVNDVLAERFDLRDTTILEPVSTEVPGESVGLGRVGNTARSFDPQEFTSFVCEKLGTRAVKFVAGKEPVTRVAVCGGTGGVLLSQAKKVGAQALVTADCKHSQLLEAAHLGITLIDAGHYATESLVMPVLLEKLKAALPDADIRLAAACTEPARFAVRD